MTSEPGRPGRPDDADSFQTSGGLILPGGKVDREALERLAAARGEPLADEDDAPLPAVTFTLKRDLKSRLDRYLASRVTFMSRTQLQRLIEGRAAPGERGVGGVLVNGRPAKPSTMLRAGDEIEVVLPPPPPSGLTPEDIPIEVLHEDEHLIVLNKAAGIIVHPARSENSGTMINALTFHLSRASRQAGQPNAGLSNVGRDLARPGVVHRLDRDTTGCIVFAKSDEAHWKLAHQFEHRRVEKRYLALVHGRVEPHADRVELPIGPHPSREKGYREMFVVRHDSLGKHALTLYRTRERYHDPERAVGDQDFTLVELELRTGRTHQIRVHLSHLGWPIVGDDMYGGRALAPAASRARSSASEPPIEPLIDRQALHAALLAFRHPITGAEMCFTAPLPLDFRRTVDFLRGRGRVERASSDGTLVDLSRAMGE